MSNSRSIVYFAYLGDGDTPDDLVRRRLSFMDRQLRWLADLIAAQPWRIDVLVPYVAPIAFDTEVHDLITRHGFRIDPDSTLPDRRNRFEYPGFRAMKALAAASPPDHLIYYCHSKGIVQLAERKMGLFRLHTEIGLTADLAALQANPALTRACLFSSKFGWCFFNFFWIKAGYMAGLTVAESDDRFHFEALVGDPTDRQGYRGVLPLIDRLSFEDTGLAARHWYRPSETDTPALSATYDLYAGMTSPAEAIDRRNAPGYRPAPLLPIDFDPRHVARPGFWKRLLGRWGTTTNRP
jgi:hypothetical protein